MSTPTEHGPNDIATVVLAAGLGTRMKSRKPKVLHEILGRPMVFYAIDAAIGVGSKPIVVVTGYGREEAEAAVLAGFPNADIRFAFQEQQLGTGHAVLCATEQIPDGVGKVLILNGDLPNLRPGTIDRLDREVRAENALVGLLTAHLDDPYGYGRIVRDDGGRVLRIVEHKDATDAERAITEINVGAYLFDTRFLLDRIGSLSADNVQAELYLPDLVAQATEMGRHAVPVVVDDPSEIAGVNSRADLADAEGTARRLRNLELMRSGVTMIDPDRTIVETDARIANDVVLWPGVIVRGRSKISSGVEIEAGSIIVDSDIGENAKIFPYCHLDNVRVGPLVQVGPFARLRPGAVLEEASKVGNFVEMKKTVLGKGSKASHLTYLGDATIGEKVNVGAGTITCNYDGRSKFQTVLEDGVFIGSDSQLVAPVTVKRGAYVGAGTTVTKTVPAGALAVTRVPQRNIEGFADRKREQWAAEDKLKGKS